MNPASRSAFANARAVAILSDPGIPPPPVTTFLSLIWKMFIYDGQAVTSKDWISIRMFMRFGYLFDKREGAIFA
jgi:hypothetical protein